jgi:hypothetical protein
MFMTQAESFILSGFSGSSAIARFFLKKPFALVLILLILTCHRSSAVVVLDSNALDIRNDLQLIGIAIHNYSDTYGHLPRDITDSSGSPLLSWRVALLPYLNQEALYNQFDLTSAWDTAPNAALVDLMPDVLRGPLDSPSSIYTHYVRSSGAGTLLDGNNDLKLPRDIPDGTSNTLLVGEFAGSMIPWTAPSDLEITKPVPALGTPGFFAGEAGDGAAFLFADGSVHFLSPDNDSDTLYSLFIRNDGAVTSYSEEKLVSPVPDTGSSGLQLSAATVLLLLLARRVARSMEKNETAGCADCI